MRVRMMVFARGGTDSSTRRQCGGDARPRPRLTFASQISLSLDRAADVLDPQRAFLTLAVKGSCQVRAIDRPQPPTRTQPAAPAAHAAAARGRSGLAAWRVAGHNLRRETRDTRCDAAAGRARRNDRRARHEMRRGGLTLAAE